MFDSINYKKLLYLDIETAGIEEHYDDLTDEYKEAWKYHCDRNKLVNDFTESELEKAWQENVALIPEFSKIICVSFGKFIQKEDGLHFKTSTFFINKDNPDEKDVLEKVVAFMDAQSYIPIAHAGKDFDYPFIIRRCLINRILPPTSLQIVGKKPWEINLHDSKDIWKFGGYRSASLATLCAAFGVPSPKSDMSGKDTHKYFHAGRNMDIAKYCNNDVKAMTMCIQRMTIVGTDEKPMEMKYTE